MVLVLFGVMRCSCSKHGRELVKHILRSVRGRQSNMLLMARRVIILFYCCVNNDFKQACFVKSNELIGKVVNILMLNDNCTERSNIIIIK